LDGYIHRKRKGSGTKLFGGFSISKKKAAGPQREEYGKDAKKGVKKMDDATYKELEDDVEEIEAEEPAQQKPEKKGGGIKGFFKKFKSDKPHIEEIDEEGPADMEGELPEEVKDVLKTTLKWIQELPPARLKDFKNSPDFEKYKEVLVKYKVAKQVEKK
jgi:hypothetical protein